MSVPAMGQQQMSAETAAVPTDPCNHVDPAPDPGAKLTLPQPSRLERRFLLLVIHLIGKFRRRVGSVLMLTKHLCVKYGRRIDLVEAQNMVFIARHTSIPVPTVHLAFMDKGRTYILMERIHGHPVGKNWVQRPADSKLAVLENLKEMVLQMRHLQTSSSLISSVNGGSLYDPRMPCITGRFGPFQNVQEFHCYLRNGIQAHSNHDADIKTLITLHSQDWNAPTFTHGDLSSQNILVRGDNIVGIIDWETAGWYPPYWEYTTACQVNPQNSFWRAEIEKFLEAVPDALAMEHLRQKYFGDF